MLKYMSGENSLPWSTFVDDKVKDVQIDIASMADYGGIPVIRCVGKQAYDPTAVLRCFGNANNRKMYDEGVSEF